MRKFTRLPEPEFLAANWEAWGIAWEQRRQQNPNAQFHWHTLAGRAVNQKLLPALQEQTQHHCSFCDNYPVSPPSIDTIEHFRPKAKYPRDAYRWTNLYFCCAWCQQKGDTFDESVLQPDAPDYRFERYFRCDFTRGTIEVNERSPEGDQHRARVTIDVYRLNDRHPRLRRRCLRLRSKCPDEPIDEWPYRDFIDEQPAGTVRRASASRGAAHHSVHSAASG